MGGCLAGPAGVFAKAPIFQVTEVLSNQELIGQQVQVLGRVAHAGHVLESPFTEKQGVAIKIRAIVPSGGHGGGAQKTLFTASCCTSFDVVDGAQAVRILVSDQRQWNLALKTTDDIHNIYRDAENESILYSGGEKPGLKSQVVVRPNAMQFWRTFNDGKDAPRLMTSLNGKGMAGFGNRPRMAKENVLQVDDLVSAVGILKKEGDMYFIDAGALTNADWNCAALKSCAAKPSAGVMQLPQVCQMSK